MTPFIREVQKGQMYKGKIRLVATRAWGWGGGGGRRLGLTVNEDDIPFRRDKNVLEFKSWRWLHNTVNIFKTL